MKSFDYREPYLTIRHYCSFDGYFQSETLAGVARVSTIQRDYTPGDHRYTGRSLVRLQRDLHSHLWDVICLPALR